MRHFATYTEIYAHIYCKKLHIISTKCNIMPQFLSLGLINNFHTLYMDLNGSARFPLTLCI